MSVSGYNKACLLRMLWSVTSYVPVDVIESRQALGVCIFSAVKDSAHTAWGLELPGLEQVIGLVEVALDYATP